MLARASVVELTVGVVVNEGEAVSVVHSAHVGLAHGETDGVGDTLAEGAGGDLDTVRDTNLGVTGGDRVDLSERLEVVHRDVVARQVEHDVLQGAGVAVGQHESVPVHPLGVLGVELHVLGPQHVRGRSHTLGNEQRTGSVRLSGLP